MVKHLALDSDELGVLLGCYKTLYPNEHIELACLSMIFARTYSTIFLEVRNLVQRWTITICDQLGYWLLGFLQMALLIPLQLEE